VVAAGPARATPAVEGRRDGAAIYLEFDLEEKLKRHMLTSFFWIFLLSTS
jgi:hypothetical protein